MVTASWFDSLRRRWSALLRWMSRSRVAAPQDALPASPAQPPAPTPPAASPGSAASAASAASADLTTTLPERSPLPPPTPSVIVRAATSTSSSSSISLTASTSLTSLTSSTSSTSLTSSTSPTSSGVLPMPPVRVVERPAEVLRPTPAATAPGSPVTALRDSGSAQLSVRLFFSRMLAATPEGLTIDFTRWQTASVERFFLAITSPGLIRRREAPTTGDERLTLPTAFDGFEWD